MSLITLARRQNNILLTGKNASTVKSLAVLKKTRQVFFNPTISVTSLGFGGLFYWATPNHLLIMRNGHSNLYYWSGSSVSTGMGGVNFSLNRDSSLAVNTKTNVVCIALGQAALGTGNILRSTDGGISATTNPTLPSANQWTGLATDNNSTWICLSNSSNQTLVSPDDGATWVAGGTLASSTSWSHLAHYNGVWLASAYTGAFVNYSIDNGQTWTSTNSFVSGNTAVYTTDQYQGILAKGNGDSSIRGKSDINYNNSIGAPSIISNGTFVLGNGIPFKGIWFIPRGATTAMAYTYDLYNYYTLSNVTGSNNGSRLAIWNNKLYSSHNTESDTVEIDVNSGFYLGIEE